MQYFIKNDKIHKYPPPSNCKVKRGKEKLYNSVPTTSGKEKCDLCFGLPR